MIFHDFPPENLKRNLTSDARDVSVMPGCDVSSRSSMLPTHQLRHPCDSLTLIAVEPVEDIVGQGEGFPLVHSSGDLGGILKSSGIPKSS